MATGTISFGLVSIPVKLYSTTVTGSRIGLNWINPETGSRVRMRYQDPTTDELIDRDDLVKGYEFAKGQFVIFTEEELEEVLFKNGLIMQQLRYASELRAFDDIEVGDVEIDKNELALAEQIVDQISNDNFEPDQYHDTARERMEAIISRKIEGQEISAAPEEETQGQIIDLMEALKKSLAENSDSRPTRKAAQRKASAKAPTKKAATAGAAKATARRARK